MFDQISTFTLSYLEKVDYFIFENCLFFKLVDISNFLASERVYLYCYVKDSQIENCAFLNFYYSLNGNRFSSQPSVSLHKIIWRNFTVRVGYFSAFSNVMLELIDSEIRDMVGIKKDQFVRFFYIRRGSSFFMNNSSVIDCGYNFELILKE